ncbi:hypothetical protein ABZV41_26550 [Streptomyces sp. NPDC005098]|uniref:hypothetical protein n=1 Tax=Streptomyces sp. NPDC005098 TaxID=3154560 RepID=UPI0033AEE3CF
MVAMALPSVAPLWWAWLRGGTAAGLAAAALSGPVFVATVCLIVAVGKQAALPRTPLGIHPAYSALGVRKWVGVADKLLEHSLLFTNSLYATLYTVPWLRLLGARVGRSAEASTVSHIDPDLLTPGSPAECVFSVGRRPCHSPRRNWAPAFNASRHAAAQHQARFFSLFFIYQDLPGLPMALRLSGRLTVLPTS